MRNRPSRQVYSNYTKQDFLVWKTLYDRQMKHLDGKVAEAFLEALEVIQFNREEIPNFEKVNAILERTTGWQL